MAVPGIRQHGEKTVRAEMRNWSRYEHPQQGGRSENAWAVGSSRKADRDRHALHEMLGTSKTRTGYLGYGTWTDRAVTQCLRSLHVRGHTCSLRPRTSTRGGRKGCKTRCDVTSHFSNRLQEKKLQPAKKYDMENDKIHAICEPYVR